eukprot:TRINITY_DN10109_c0_g1_i1.p1 TRINITY_DN10109_c0_g1~~TRINITY_DN10109_c0_g1_i1.p1  ORF type:complete len:266 (+),score=43.67 TRINITY_DN10109_c0_g1_i1:44-841(+)
MSLEARIRSLKVGGAAKEDARLKLNLLSVAAARELPPLRSTSRTSMPSASTERRASLPRPVTSSSVLRSLSQTPRGYYSARGGFRDPALQDLDGWWTGFVTIAMILHGKVVSYSIPMKYSDKYGILKQQIATASGVPYSQLQLMHKAGGREYELRDDDTTDNARTDSGLTRPDARAVILHPSKCVFISVNVVAAPPAERRIVVDLFVMSPVSALKEHIEQQLRYPVHHQVLMFGSSYLDRNERSLDEYGIKHNSRVTLYLMARLQ